MKPLSPSLTKENLNRLFLESLAANLLTDWINGNRNDVIKHIVTLSPIEAVFVVIVLMSNMEESDCIALGLRIREEVSKS